MNYKERLSYSTPISIIFFAVLVFFPSYAQVNSLGFTEEKPVVSIDNPTGDSVVFATSEIINGTYRLVNSTDSYSISVSIDGSGYTPSSGSNFWSIDTSLSSGYHNIIVEITENGISSSDSENFGIIAGHTAASRLNLILVYYSEACQKMVNNNDFTTCPSLGALKQYDNSNPKYAGEIVFNNSTGWQRSSPETTNWYLFINSTGTETICVECNFPLDRPDYAQELFIEPTNFQYANLDTQPFTNTTETYFNGTQYLQRYVTDPEPVYSLSMNSSRYVSEDCMTSDIFYTPQIMNDTLLYLNSGCKNTHLNLSTNMTLNTTPFYFDHSIWFKMHNWLTKALSSSVNNCITQKCDNPEDPYHNSGFGWK